MPARILLALDTPDVATAVAQTRAVGAAVDGVKLGLEFFIANGPAGVREVQARGPAAVPRPQVPRHPQHRGGRRPQRAGLEARCC